MVVLHGRLDTAAASPDFTDFVFSWCACACAYVKNYPC